MRVLVTRPGRPAARTAERLRVLGHDALIEPLLELDFHPPPHLVEEKPPDGLILTSSNAVRALAGHRDLPRLVGLPLWTVGSRTTAAARELGFHDLRAEVLDLHALAALLRTLPDKEVLLLHAAGRDRAGDLSDMIGPDGPRIDTRIVYTAHKARELAPSTSNALRRGEVDAVLHYSRRTAEAYLELTQRIIPATKCPPVHLCLSAAVAEPLLAVGASVRVATLPTEDALLRQLDDEASPRQPGFGALDNPQASTARKSMADPDTPGAKIADEPRRSMKPRQAVIDVDAKEVYATPHETLEVVTPGVDTPPAETDTIIPAAPEADASAADAPRAFDPEGGSTANAPSEPTPAASTIAEPSSASDAEPRSSLGSLIGAGLAGAVIAIVALLLLVSSELIPLGSTDNPALANRVAAVEAEVERLGQAPAAIPATPDANPVAGDLAAQVETLRQQVEELRTTAAPAAAAAVEAPQGDAAAGEQLAALDSRISELASRVEPLTSAPQAANADAVALLSSRLDELAGRITAPREPDPASAQALQQAGSATEAAGRAETQAQQALDQTGQARQASEKAAADAAAALERADRAATLASLATLESAIMRGTPYAGALANAQDRLPEPVVATLKAKAEGGLPTLDILGARLSEAVGDAPAPEVQSEGLVDRMVEGARSLVRVRPAPGSSREVQGSDSWAVRNRIQADLERRAYADALNEWNALDEPAKNSSRDAADALRERLAVDQALDSVRSDLVQNAGATQ